MRQRNRTRGHKIQRLVWLATVCWVFSSGSAACFAGTPSWARENTELLTERARLAATYLHGAITDSGKFVYRRDRGGDHRGRNRYNILRHAGALYALADYHLDFTASVDEIANLRRAARYLVECCAGPLPGRPDLTAIWSDPELTGKRHELKAKLGAAGLSLTALVTSGYLVSGITDKATLERLGRFVQYMQEPSGRFVSRYDFALGEKDDSWNSLYYPGEAALGLYYLHQMTDDAWWLESSVDALRYLARQRERLVELPADHWALIATSRIMGLNPRLLGAVAPAGIPWTSRDGSPSIRDSLLVHAHKVVDSVLMEQRLDPGNKCLDGGFNAEGRVAPTATRLEGLISALGFLAAGERRTRVMDAVERGIGFLLESQLLDPPYSGAVPRVNPACESDDRRAREIRIDYVQHTLSAFLLYLRHRPPGR